MPAGSASSGLGDWKFKAPLLVPSTLPYHGKGSWVARPPAATSNSSLFRRNGWGIWDGLGGSSRTRCLSLFLSKMRTAQRPRTTSGCGLRVSAGRSGSRRLDLDRLRARCHAKKVDPSPPRLFSPLIRTSVKCESRPRNTGLCNRCDTNETENREGPDSRAMNAPPSAHP